MESAGGWEAMGGGGPGCGHDGEQRRGGNAQVKVGWEGEDASRTLHAIRADVSLMRPSQAFSKV